MNWGTKILILYSCFVAMILLLVFKAMSQKVDLVASDYYEQEIKYQDKIDAINNTTLLSTPIVIETQTNQVKLSFPKEFTTQKIKGEITFFRPSNSDMDMKIDLQLNDSCSQVISSDKFKRGLYKAQIKWIAGGHDYFYEESIFIN